MASKRRKGLDVWFARPLKFTIIDLLDKHRGRISLSELIKELEEIYVNISISQINRALMNLEIEGIIHVEAVSPKEMIIEKIPKERLYLPITED